MSNNHPLGITVASLREMLADKDDTLVIDELIAVANPDPDGPDGSTRLLVTGSRDLDTPPDNLIGNDAPLRLEVGLLRGLLERFPADAIIDAVEPGLVPGSFELKGHTQQTPVAAHDQVFMAPLGTPFPTTSEELHDPLGPWKNLGRSVGDGVTLKAEPHSSTNDYDRTAALPGFSASLELELSDPSAFRDFIDSLVDDQLDRTLAAADKAEDGMDLDRLAAELRLMLPEPELVVTIAFGETEDDDHIDEALDEYSAEAIVAWFRQELAIARRRAYRTGYALGRHAGEHQEPTA
jgi:hypothetical protein